MQSFAAVLLRLYKRWISPAFPPACRYVPTCSEYAMEAIERYGALRGGTMAAWRLLRCHPFAKGGLDPVLKHPVMKKMKNRMAKDQTAHHPIANHSKRGPDRPRHAALTASD
jgi:putative membrane protein insertion efficiency factor